MSSAEDFLSKLKAAAAKNAGKPLGELRFYQLFGLSRTDLYDAGFESYGAACLAAELRPNTLRARMSEDDLLRPLAILARKLGKFPPKGAIEVERRRDASFPSWEAFTRRKKEGPQSSLREILHAWSAASAEFADVAEILKSSTQSPQAHRSPDSRQVVKGFVYLMRYGSSGKVYKIGVAENVPRRHAQIRMMAPQDVRIVHSIPSDDPYGIEQYWHTRFAQKIVEGKKELFHLSPVDVAAFKSRTYQ